MTETEIAVESQRIKNEIARRMANGEHVKLRAELEALVAQALRRVHEKLNPRRTLAISDEEMAEDVQRVLNDDRVNRPYILTDAQGRSDSQIEVGDVVELVGLQRVQLNYGAQVMEPRRAQAVELRKAEKAVQREIDAPLSDAAKAILAAVLQEAHR